MRGTDMSMERDPMRINNVKDLVRGSAYNVNVDAVAEAIVARILLTPGTTPGARIRREPSPDQLREV